MNIYKLQKEEAEIRTLLSIVVDDIKYAKNKQWSLTYYVLLTYAALIGFCSFLEDKPFYDDIEIKFIIIIPAILISIVGIYNLLDTHKRIAFYRERINKIQKYLSFEPRSIINIRPEQNSHNYAGFDRYFWFLTVPFIGVIFFGLSYVIIFVLKK